MNKFTMMMIAGVLVFVAVAQLVSAGDNDGLVNEMGDDDDVDDELEGSKFGSLAKKLVGVSATERFGYDFLDKNKGLENLAEKRTPECKSSKGKKACETCCSGRNKAYSYKPNIFASDSGCTCYDRDNSYNTILQ